MKKNYILISVMVISLLLASLSGCKYYENYSEVDNSSDVCVPEFDGDCEAQTGEKAEAIDGNTIAEVNLDTKIPKAKPAQITASKNIPPKETGMPEIKNPQGSKQDNKTEQINEEKIEFVDEEELEAKLQKNQTKKEEPTERQTSGNATANAKEEPKTKEYPTKTVTEGEMVSFASLTANDPDGDKIRVAFGKPLDKNGEWQTKIGDAGEYETIIKVSDSKTAVEQKVRIIVKATNRPPVLTVQDRIEVNETQTVVINFKAEDPEGDDLVVQFSGWMSSDKYTTTYDDAGTYKVIVTASDSKSETRKEILVIVNDINRPPVIDMSGMVD